MKIEEQIIYKAFVHINNSYQHSIPMEYYAILQADDIRCFFERENEFDILVGKAVCLIERDRIKTMLKGLD